MSRASNAARTLAPRVDVEPNGFEVDAEEKAALLLAMEEADRDEVIPADEVLAKLRRG